MKKVIVLLAVILTICMCGCSAQGDVSLATNQDNHGVSNSGQTTFHSETAHYNSTDIEEVTLPQGDNEMEQTLRKLVDSNYSCITSMFYYGVLPYDTSEYSEDKHATVQSSEFKSVEDLRNYLVKTFTQEEVNMILTKYIDGNPLYLDEDGVLKVDLTQASFAGMPVPWRDYTIEIQSLNHDECMFVVTAFFEDDPIREGPDSASYAFCAKLEDGWKLTKMVYQPVR